MISIPQMLLMSKNICPFYLSLRMKLNSENVIICRCNKISQLHFSRNKRLPFIGCVNCFKRNGERCSFEIYFDDNDTFNEFNAKNILLAKFELRNPFSLSHIIVFSRSCVF